MLRTPSAVPTTRDESFRPKSRGAIHYFSCVLQWLLAPFRSLSSQSKLDKQRPDPKETITTSLEIRSTGSVVTRTLRTDSSPAPRTRSVSAAVHSGKRAAGDANQRSGTEI